MVEAANPILVTAMPTKSVGEEEEACIYFRMGMLGNEPDYADCMSDWYMMNAETPDGAYVSPVFPKHPINPYFFSLAAVGPIIYTIGGMIDYKRSTRQTLDKVYWIDTRYPEHGWKEGPRMLGPRMDSHAVAIDDKIYLFDLNHTEVLDCSNNIWSSLSHHNEETTITAHAVLDGGKRILLHMAFLNALHEYDVEADSWSVYDDKGFGFIGYAPTFVAFVDGVIYCNYCGEPGVIYAYDISQPPGSTGLARVNGLKCIKGGHGRALLHLGNGKLCYVFPMKKRGLEDFDLILICRVVFRVSKRIRASGKVVFNAEILTDSHCCVRGAFSIFNCLAVFRSQGMKTHAGVFNEGDNSTITSMEYNISNSDTTNNIKKKKKNRVSNECDKSKTTTSDYNISSSSGGSANPTSIKIKNKNRVSNEGDSSMITTIDYNICSSCGRGVGGGKNDDTTIIKKKKKKEVNGVIGFVFLFLLGVCNYFFKICV